MGEAPNTASPSTIAWPTPPQPTTTALSPARTPAVLSTAPTPVVIAQPIRAATAGGTAAGGGARGGRGGVDRHGGRLRHQRGLGEGAETEERVHGGAVRAGERGA